MSKTIFAFAIALLLGAVIEVAHAARPNEVKLVPDDLDATFNVEFELFLPPSIEEGEPVRGVIVASRYQAGSEVYTHAGYRDLADRLGFAVLRHALYRDRGGRPRLISDDQAARLLSDGLRRLAERTDRPELADAPLVLTGLSASGHQAVVLANHLADRTLAIVGYHTRGVMSYDDASFDIPGLFLIGGRDSFYSPLVSHLHIVHTRRRGARLCGAVYQPLVPHQKLGSDEVVLAWLDEVIRLRLPDKPVELGRKPSLRRIDPDAGWLCTVIYDPQTEIRTFADPATKVVPASAFKGDAAEAYWMPSEAVAMLWQAESGGGDEQPKLGPEDLGSLQRPAEVRPAPTAFSLDGLAEDWAEVEPLPAPYSGLDHGSLRVGWRDDGLYGLVVVPDQHEPERSATPPPFVFELFLDGALSRARSRDAPAHALLTAAGRSKPRGEGARQIVFAPDSVGRDGAPRVREIRLYRGGGDGEGIQAVYGRGDDGFRLEFFVPADRVGPGTLEHDRVIGFNYALTTDGRDAEYFFESNRNSAHAIPALWGAIRLIGEPRSP